MRAARNGFCSPSRSALTTGAPAPMRYLSVADDFLFVAVNDGLYSCGLADRPAASASADRVLHPDCRTLLLGRSAYWTSQTLGLHGAPRRVAAAGAVACRDCAAHPFGSYSDAKEDDAEG